MWVVFAILSAVFAALVAIFGKVGLEHLDTTLATTVRSIIMAVFLSIITLALGKFSNFSFNSFDKKEWLFIVLAGVAGALSWLCYFFALKTGNTSAVVAIDKLSIIAVVIIAAIFLSEGLTIPVVIGAVLMTTGAILIAWK